LIFFILPQAALGNFVFATTKNLEASQIVFNLIALNWPVVALCLLYFLRSPLLLLPVSITVITFAILSAIDKMIRITRGVYLQSAIASIPYSIYLTIMLFETLSYWSYYREYRSWARELEREESTTRRVVGALALVGAYFYVALMIGFMIYFSPDWSILLSSCIIIAVLRGLVFPPRSGHLERSPVRPIRSTSSEYSSSRRGTQPPR
jgi:hypothetical protein